MARGAQASRNQADPTDWVTRAADDAIRHAGGGAGLITCASGASPSGPIHLGNLREFLTVHFVAEEIRRRGIAVRHLHSWDDYDRFRKVPAGVDPSWADHIGRPLSAVPDPWECHESWAEHFKEPLRAALAEMGVEMEEVSQTERYRAGAYRDQILTAVERRGDIERVLTKYRTKAAPVAETEEQAAELEDSVANDDTDGEGELARFPYKPYCRDCGRDTTTVTSYDDTTTDLAYVCDVCSYEGVTNLSSQSEGKLVWKVDWPMRWAVEGVDFEPGGVDHATPGSSYTVGKELVKEIYGGRAPSFVGYSFVGAGGQVKMSSSRGGVPTAADALKILEAPILRWLYVRRQPKQAFNVDFGPEVVRLYDEWDSLTRKAANPDKRDAQVLAFERACATAAAGTLPTPAVVVPFRVLSSVADVTAGSADLISRTVSHVGYAHSTVERARATPHQGDDLDRRVRARRGPHHGAHGPGRRAAGVALGAGAPLALAAARGPARGAGGRARDDPGLRGAEARPRPAPRRRPHRRGEGRPEGVLHAALQPARRCRPGPPVAHVDRGLGQSAGEVAARDVGSPA